MKLTAEQVAYLHAHHSPADPLLERVHWLDERGVELLPERLRQELIGAGLLAPTWPDQDSRIARVHPDLWRRLTDATVLPHTAEARLEAVRAVVGDILAQTPTTTHHQDARVEAVLTDGPARLLDLVAGALPGEVAPLLDVVRPELLARSRDLLLELLAAVGVDTSAHVRAPRAEVHVHRTPPHDTEGG